MRAGGRWPRAREPRGGGDTVWALDRKLCHRRVVCSLQASAACLLGQPLQGPQGPRGQGSDAETGSVAGAPAVGGCRAGVCPGTVGGGRAAGVRVNGLVSFCSESIMGNGTSWCPSRVPRRGLPGESHFRPHFTGKAEVPASQSRRQVAGRFSHPRAFRDLPRARHSESGVPSPRRHFRILGSGTGRCGCPVCP